MKKYLLSGLAACLFPLSAQALPLSPYIGADYIYSDIGYSHDYEKFSPEKLNSGAAIVGVKILPGIAVEGFFQQSENKNREAGSVVQYGDIASTDMKIRSYGADLVTDILHLYKVELMGSVGVARYDVDVSSKRYYGNNYNHASETWNGTALRLGLGAQFNITDHYSVRAMGRYIRTDMDNLKDIKEFSIGMRYYFW